MRSFVSCWQLCLLGCHLFAFAGEQGTLGDSQVDYVFEESTGTLTLTGTGATPDYTPESLPPFAAHRSQIRTVQVEEGITGLGTICFAS